MTDDLARLNRRKVILSASGVVLTNACGTNTTSAGAVTGMDSVSTEPNGVIVERVVNENGDIEITRYDPSAVTAFSSTPLASLEDRLANYPQSIIDVSTPFIGKAAPRDAETLSDIADVFQRMNALAGGGIGSWNWCAAGISYVAMRAYAEEYAYLPEDRIERISTIRKFAPEVREYHFQPHVSCRDMAKAAQSTRTLFTYDQVRNGDSPTPRPGWVTLYYFGNNNYSHCGFLSSFDASRMAGETVEFNTRVPGGRQDERSGNGVARKSRKLMRDRKDPKDKYAIAAFINTGGGFTGL